MADPEIPEAAVNRAAVSAASDAMTALLKPFAHQCNLFVTGQVGLISPTTTEVATAALTAAAPHLTGPLVEEVARLRADARQRYAEVVALRCLLLLSTHALGQIELLTARLDGDASRPLDATQTEQVYRLASDAVSDLREIPDAAPEVAVEMREWLIRGETIADDQAEYGLTTFVRADDVHEVIRAYLVANGLPVPPAVLRETPAPEPVVETPEPADEIDEFHPDYCPAELAFDNRHSPEYFKRGFLCAWCHADPPAVLAETSAPTAEEG